MSTSHTPGPWFIWKELAMQRVGCDTDEITDALYFDSDHSIYAGNPKECTRGILKGHRAHICDVDVDSFDFDDDEDVCRSTALANARLIASAPDLLLALELLVAGIENRVGDTHIPLVKAREAIAKATGGTT